MFVASPRTSPSSRGLGRGPFKAKTRVRIPVGTPPLFRPLKRMAVIPVEHLSGLVRAAVMRAMNYAADVEHRDIAAIAREFLESAISSDAQTSR